MCVCVCVHVCVWVRDRERERACLFKQVFPLISVREEERDGESETG